MTQRPVWLWLLIGLCAARLVWQGWQWYPRVSPSAAPGRGARTLRTPPPSYAECQQPAPVAAAPPRAVRPWRAVKSWRGRKKRIDTAGHTCGNPGWVYYGVTNAQVYAWVGYGGHGKTDHSQDLRCQAGPPKVTERRPTGCIT